MKEIGRNVRKTQNCIASGAKSTANIHRLLFREGRVDAIFICLLIVSFYFIQTIACLFYAF